MYRLFDVLFSAVAAVLLLPLFLPIVLILRFTGEGEVFYAQERVGIGGKKIYILKFATMLKASPSIGAGEVTLKNDPRVLPFGKFLRKTKINELPQILNILKGDISIVGPRPMVPKTFAQYPEPAKDKLLKVRPGLTGIGSIVFRDEERYLDGLEDPWGFYCEEIIPHKANLELWFVENHSLRLYFLLIFLTAWVVLFPESRLPFRVLKGLPEMAQGLEASKLN